jgi:transposase
MDRLEGHNDYRINSCLSVIKSLNDEVNTVLTRILLLAKADENTKLLMTISGIGYYSALLIVSEIGEINRFPDSYHLCSYAGLVLSTHNSGRVTHYGSSITKAGSKYLRWIMLECVHAHIRTEKDSNIAHFYYRIAKKKGNSEAAVSAAAKLLKAFIGL